MKLLMNVGIFSTGFLNGSTVVNTGYERGLLHRDDQLDIFKYMLSSYSSFLHLVDKAHINVELEQPYKHRKQELEQHLQQVFGDKLYYRNTRNTTQQQWQETCKLFDKDDYIWFICNHDHIYIAPNNNALEDNIHNFTQDKHPYTALYFSHWPTILSCVGSDIPQKHNMCHRVSELNCSIEIISQPVLQSWWCDKHLSQNLWRRTDEKRYATSSPHNTHIYIPTAELCRHYDGYGMKTYMYCPPLVIPPGFFDNKVKIRYGYQDNYPDCVNINPLKENYTIVDKNGTDYKWVLEDLPPFWEKHISDIDIFPNIDHDKMKKARNEAVLISALCHRDPTIPTDKIPQYEAKIIDYIKDYIL